jgi:hypothetical protein
LTRPQHIPPKVRTVYNLREAEWGGWVIHGPRLERPRESPFGTFTNKVDAALILEALEIGYAAGRASVPTPIPQPTSQRTPA